MEMKNSGWLEHLKKDMGMRQLSVTGEKSASMEEVAAFVAKLDKIIESENLSSQQIYNCDETGLNYKMLPTKTLASREEKSAPGFNQNKKSS